MFLHVDIVKNDWLTGKQVRLGVIALEGEKLMPQFHDPDIADRVLRPFEDPSTGEMIHPEKEPLRFISSLHRVMGGSSWFATPPYRDPKESAFHSADELAFVSG